MKRFLFFLCLVCGVYTKSVLAQSWETLPNTPVLGPADLALAHPADAKKIFLAAEGAFLISSDDGETWKESIALGSSVKINAMEIQDGLYLLTAKGLFYSSDNGKNWRSLFQPASPQEQNTLCIAHDPSRAHGLYLGTEGGLFMSADNGQSWQKDTGALAGQAIYRIRWDETHRQFWIAADEGLYQLDPKDKSIRAIHLLPKQTIAIETDEMPEDIAWEEEAEKKKNVILDITLTGHGTLALATPFGVWIGSESQWEHLPTSGLQNIYIRSLVYSAASGRLIAGTDQGVYLYDATAKRWAELIDGIRLTKIRRLDMSTNIPETLYAATDEGAYRFSFAPENRGLPLEIKGSSWSLAQELFQKEPTIHELRKKAIRYANVGPWKTKRWHMESRLKSLVPSFSIGKSLSTSSSVDLDRGGTGDQDIYILGPDDRTRGWDMDVQWDVSELIWNSSQTSIDSREKLMVEMRNDLLRDLTRLYFERRRVQTELFLKPPKNLLAHQRILLRIDELTAQLDMLTDGAFSLGLERLYNHQPQFLDLWKFQDA